MTLESFKKLALETSPEVREARELYEASDKAYKGQLAASVLPTLAFTGQTYPYGHNPADGYRFQTWRLNRNDMNFNTTANLNLFNSFQDVQKTRYSSLSRGSAQSGFEAARQDRAFSAIQTFFDLDSKSQLLEVARQNLDAQQEQYQQTLDLHHNGMKSLSDLLKSETDWRSSELRLVSAQAEQKAALVRFNLLIDRPGSQPALLQADLATGTTDLPRVEADLALALTRRPEVSRVRKEFERSAVALEQAAQGLLPTFSANAVWNRSDAATFGRPAAASTVPNPNYQVGLTLALPFNFNVVTQAFSYAGARADKRRARSAVDAALRLVRQDVHGAFINLERATLSYGISLKKEDIARRNLDLINGQYRQGSADVIHLAQAQTDFLNAQVERTLALHDIFINRALYKRAVGEPLW